MLEIEMKFRVDDADAYERLVRETLGVDFGAPSLESDVFFTNEALGFPNQGKSLRIRRRDNYLAATFKGPRLDNLTKTREEIELPLLDEAEELNAANAARVEEARRNWIRFYERLGFCPFGVVEKTRRRAQATFEGREFELTFDAIDGLGAFTELETRAPQEELGSARASVLALAKKLRLNESIVKSYLALTLEKTLGREVDEK